MLSSFCPARFIVLFRSVVLSWRYTLETPGASLLTGDMFECDIAHRRTVAELCIYAVQDQV